MPANHLVALLLCAAAVLIGVAHSSSTSAGDTAEILRSQRSQTADTNPIQPSSDSEGPPYQLEQEAADPEPQGLKGYLDANEQISIFGIELRVETRTAEKEIQGLLVVDIEPGSPGAAAGLHPYRQPIRDVLNGVAMLGVMMFPPAIIVAPLVGSVPLHENYDLVIGIDGFRVASFLDFYERVRDTRPGEVIYLNILRNGHRVQVPLQITSAVPPPESWVQ
ncbi:MAG TPA: PDZ domain-containing protein [Candidatus Binataceae bacterium]|nr:PDZ domain-containing protein [Candidatus Binataceae bacterium]